MNDITLPEVVKVLNGRVISTPPFGIAAKFPSYHTAALFAEVASGRGLEADHDEDNVVSVVTNGLRGLVWIESDDPIPLSDVPSPVAPLR